jgi:glyoxylase-like metal-dependent hydrolase (beta-lactamase superfamily II)
MRVTNNLFVLGGGHFSAVDPASALGEIYGIRTPEGFILIDSGIPVKGMENAREVLDYFEVKEPITHLLVTHCHWDHCGCAKELQASGVKVVVGLEDVSHCLDGGLTGSPFEEGNSFPAFTPDITIGEDQTLTIHGIAFEFIKIPGHTPGSMAIRARIDGKTALFTGDTLALDSAREFDNFTFGWQGDPAFDRTKVLASILKLRGYETDLVLPGHGKVCLRDGTALLNNAARAALLTLR